MKNKNLLKFLLVKKNNKGIGVYTLKNYKKGEIICVMKGEKTKPKSLYYHLKNIKNAQMNPLQISSLTYLNLYKPYIYFNHSCDPNAAIRDKTTLFALKNIKKGEEITYDYSTTIDESFVCKCGSKKCRHAVSDFFALPLKIQKYYISHNATPLFIRKKFFKINKRLKGR